jgi:hypothetical protein
MIFAIDDISEHHVVPVSRDTRSASRAAERCTDIGVRLLHAIKHEDLLVGEVGRAFECDVIPISRNVWVSLELHIRVDELCTAVGHVGYGDDPVRSLSVVLIGHNTAVPGDRRI